MVVAFVTTEGHVQLRRGVDPSRFQYHRHGEPQSMVESPGFNSQPRCMLFPYFRFSSPLESAPNYIHGPSSSIHNASWVSNC